MHRAWSNRIELLLWLLLACAGPSAAVAWQEGGDVRTLGTIPAGSAMVVVGRDGSIGAKQDGRELISGTALVIAAPGWTTSVSQRSCRPMEGYPRREEDAFVFKGEMTEKGSGAVWQFEQRVCPVGNAVRVTYEVQPVKGLLSRMCGLKSGRYTHHKRHHER